MIPDFIVNGLAIIGGGFVLLLLVIALDMMLSNRGMEAPARFEGGPVGSTHEINGHRVVKIARQDWTGAGFKYEKTLGYKCKDCFLQKQRKRDFFDENCKAE